MGKHERTIVEKLTGIECRDCIHYHAEKDGKETYKHNFAKCSANTNDITYCNVNRTLSHLCGFATRWFEPADKWKILHATDDAYLFQQDHTAFWNDPNRWEGVNHPHPTSPKFEAFWMKAEG